MSIYFDENYYQWHWPQKKKITYLRRSTLMNQPAHVFYFHQEFCKAHLGFVV